MTTMRFAPAPPPHPPKDHKEMAEACVKWLLSLHES